LRPAFRDIKALGADPECVKQIDADLKESFSRLGFKPNSIRNYALNKNENNSGKQASPRKFLTEES
jgi:hypothetical protein